MEKIELQDDDLLYPGDLVELHYRTMGPTWLRAAHVAAIERNINNSDQFKWVRQEYGDNNKIIFRVQVVSPEQKPPEVQKAGVVSGAIALSVLFAIIGAVVWLTKEAAYKIIESPAGRVGIAGLGTMGIAAGITAIWALLRGKK